MNKKFNSCRALKECTRVAKTILVSGGGRGLHFEQKIFGEWQDVMKKTDRDREAQTNKDVLKSRLDVECDDTIT